MSNGPLSYEPFFGLRKKPFSLAPDPEFLYESPSHAAALEALSAGIRRREGLLALTGDVGMGKTTICRAVLRNLDRKTFSAFVPDPFASREDLLKMLLIDFGVASIQDFTTGPLAQAGRTELSYLLSSFLQTLVPLEAFVVVFIDEAQNMSASLIEEVRVLADAFSHHGQLQIMFVGQLELMDTLKSPGLRQVDQRVSVYSRLEPLAPADIAGYVNHRLQIAGGANGRPLFTPGALSMLHQASQGIPRLINRTCDRALHEAYRRRSAVVDSDLLMEVLDDAPPRAVIRPQPAVEIPPPTPRTISSFATQVDSWLSEIDRSPQTEAPTRALDGFAKESEQNLATASTFVPVDHYQGRAPRRSYRYIERIGRRWGRAVVLATVALLALRVIVAAASYLPTQLISPSEPTVATLAVLPSTPLWERGPTRLAAPVAFESPAVDASEQLVVAVGVFSTAERTAQLLEELALQGLPAFTRALTQGDRLRHQILLGPFESHAAAAADLNRLRALGGYSDAHVTLLQRVAR